MIEVYRSTNTNYQKNGDITLTPLECIFEWGLDGICQIELTHEYDDLGRWEYLVNDNVIAAPTPYSDKQLFRIYKREKERRRSNSIRKAYILRQLRKLPG